MQVFRLMGLPDKVIAFDQLPERLLEGLELCRAQGFPRHWKEYLGKIKKVVKLPPERDPLTGQVRTFAPIIEEDHFFYLIDWGLGPVVERWGEICDFVRQHVDKNFRLKEKLQDMALPLAENHTDGVTLEPEDVVVIHIPVEYQEKTPKLVAQDGLAIEKSVGVKCEEDGCGREFENKRALRMHSMKKHAKEAVA